MRLALLGLFVAAPLAAQTFDTTITRTIAPGIVHKRLVSNAGPWNINALFVDLRRSGASVEAAHANDQFLTRETVLSIADRHSAAGATVVAAINADFFHTSTGEVVNNMVADGEIWRAARYTDSQSDPTRSVHSQFAMTRSGRPVIERFVLAAEVRGSGGTVALDALNARPQGEGITLYTERFGAATPSDSGQPARWELPLTAVGRRGDTLIYRVAGPVRISNRTPLAKAGVLSATQGRRQELERLGAPGTTVTVVVGLAPGRGSLRSLVGGWPRLVVDGASVADSIQLKAEGVFPGLAERHPRTAVGMTRDSSTLILVTVDGRQARSVGMSLSELAGLMLALGAREAVNLDGGGSTTMIVGGRVANWPSDSAGPRPVGNALLVVRRERAPGRVP